MLSFAAVAASFSFAASASVEFKSGGEVLRLADANGAVESLVAVDGSERLVAAIEAFTLQLLDEKGERIGFASNWRREPSELKITHADGRVETRTLAPLETIELKK
jgi:hypothetical protein